MRLSQLLNGFHGKDPSIQVRHVTDNDGTNRMLVKSVFKGGQESGGTVRIQGNHVSAIILQGLKFLKYGGIFMVVVSRVSPGFHVMRESVRRQAVVVLGTNASLSAVSSSSQFASVSLLR